VASSGQPGGTGGPPLTPPYLALLRAGFTWHPTSPPNPVSSYLTLSPLPAVAGGLLSVALSLGLPPLDVIQRLALWSPDFPPLHEQRRPSVLLQPIHDNVHFSVRCDLQISNEDFCVLVAVSPGMARRRTDQYVEQACRRRNAARAEKDRC